MRIRQLSLLAVAAAVLVTSGCGGSKGEPIPRDLAAQIISRLQEASRRGQPDAFRCNDLRRDTIPALQSQVNSLPPNTDSKIKSTLTDGIDHLNDLVSQHCNQQQVPTNTQTNTQTTQTTTQSVPTTPPTTNTQTNTNTNTNTNPNTNTNTNTTPSNGGTPPSPGAALPPGQQRKVLP